MAFSSHEGFDITGGKVTPTDEVSLISLHFMNCDITYALYDREQSQYGIIRRSTQMCCAPILNAVVMFQLFIQLFNGTGVGLYVKLSPLPSLW